MTPGQVATAIGQPNAVAMGFFFVFIAITLAITTETRKTRRTRRATGVNRTLTKSFFRVFPRLPCFRGESLQDPR